MTTHEVGWLEFEVVESRGNKHFRCANIQQACMLADNFWRETGSDAVVILRGGAPFDTGAVSTTEKTRHFTGVAKCTPEPGARYPADMSGEFLTRLCADWFCVGDVIKVQYDRKLFLRRRQALEASAFLK